MCVQVCCCDALVYSERETEDIEPQEKRGECEVGLEYLVNKHGLDKVVAMFAQCSKKGKD